MSLLGRVFPQALPITTKQKLHTNPAPGNSWTPLYSEQFNTSTPVGGKNLLFYPVFLTAPVNAPVE